MCTILTNSACWVVISLCCLLAPVSAAEFKRDRGEDEIVAPVYIDGEIEPGDQQKLLDILGEDVGQKGMPLFIHLNSKGGNFEEAIKIAGVARERFLSTKLGPGSTCLSACAIVFMSGMNYNTRYFVKSRFMHPSATLGFHAPTITAGGGNFDAADLEAAYSRAIEQIGKKLLATARYQDQSWTSPLIKATLVNEMMMTRGSNYFYIDTVGKAAEFEIELDRAIGPPKASVSFMRNACRNATLTAYDTTVSDGVMKFLIETEPRRVTNPDDNSMVYRFDLGKDRFCDVNPRANFGAYSEFDEGNSISVYVGGSTVPVYAADWFFYPSDTKLVSILAREGPRWDEPKVNPKCLRQDGKFDFDRCTENSGYSPTTVTMPHIGKGELEGLIEEVKGQASPDDVRALEELAKKAGD